MKLPIYKRINREDLQEAPDWIGRLLYPLNNVFETVYNTLNQNITFGENIQSFQKTLEFTTKATYTGGDWDAISFAIPDSFKVRTSGLWIISGGPKVAAVSGIHGLYLSWSESNRAISVDWIGGLANSTTYVFTVLGI